MRHLFLAVVLAAPCVAQATEDSTHRLHREGVLGTSMTLVVHGGDQALAEQVEARVLEEVEKLAAVLSGYDPESELRRFAASHGEQKVSFDLARVLRACEQWRERSGGAFEPGVAAIAALWRDAGKQEPDAGALAAAVERAHAPQWSLDFRTRTAERLGDAPFDLDGLAKGYVLDGAARRAWLKFGRDLDGFVLDIGGDLVVAGEGERPVGVVDPRRPADNAEPLCQILVGGAVATSGGYARGFEVGGKHRSHILDPRTGRPVEHVLGATVVAPDAVTADALATILNVVEPQQGLALVAEREGVQCLIVAADGTIHRSPGWSSLEVGAASDPADVPATAGAGWPEGQQMVVAFELADPSAGGGGRRGRGGAKRPYVAVWVEDASGQPVRTLALWVENLKWLRDLRQWSRLHGRDRDFVDSISRATRRPGAYELAWDGLDDQGHAVPAGSYTVFLEAAREHGTYQLMKQAVTVGGRPFEHELEGNAEISAAAIRFGSKSGANR